MKRLFDLVVGTILMIVTAPIQLVTAWLIRVDSAGSAFFQQKRIGLHGQAFDMLKFRTMEYGADESAHLLHIQQLRAAGLQDGASLRMDRDERITRVGRYLRRLSLDELPNLWNVVKGEMSLVGPRPLVPAEAELLAGSAQRRHHVRPGITGLAQINGRDTIAPEERNRLDVEYVENRSFAMDLRILALTLPSMLRPPRR